jgi:hypothetical protein
VLLTFASLSLECWLLHLEIGIFIEKKSEKAYSLGTCFESLHFMSQS